MSNVAPERMPETPPGTPKAPEPVEPQDIPVVADVEEDADKHAVKNKLKVAPHRVIAPAKKAAKSH